MELERKCLRAGGFMIACALLLRFLSSGVLGAMAKDPQVASVVLLMETGRMVRPIQEQEETEQTTQTPQSEPQIPETIQDTQSPNPQPVLTSFSEEDADLVEVNNVCGYEADIQTLLQTPLSWDLTAEEPAVLILHSHATESYCKTEEYTESSDYRTLDTDYNVVSVGSRVAEILEAGGIQVLHDKTLHDYPSYNSAYGEARDTIAWYLENYPSIQMVLDIHRDSVELSDGSQVAYTVTVGQQEVAQLMMVVGTDANGLSHPAWQKNMALAVKLHVQLEKTTPGICRPISFRSQRFNQDMSAGAMLIEVGSAGNTRTQALLAAEQLAQGILALAHGTTGQMS